MPPTQPTDPRAPQEFRSTETVRAVRFDGTEEHARELEMIPARFPGYEWCFAGRDGTEYANAGHWITLAENGRPLTARLFPPDGFSPVRPDAVEVSREALAEYLARTPSTAFSTGWCKGCGGGGSRHAKNCCEERHASNRLSLLTDLHGPASPQVAKFLEAWPSLKGGVE